MDNTWWRWGEGAGLLRGHGQDESGWGVTVCGTPGAECQWWADRLGDEWWSAGAPTVFPSHGSSYGNWEVFRPGCAR